MKPNNTEANWNAMQHAKSTSSPSMSQKNKTQMLLSNRGLNSEGTKITLQALPVVGGASGWHQSTCKMQFPSY